MKYCGLGLETFTTECNSRVERAAAITQIEQWVYYIDPRTNNSIAIAATGEWARLACTKLITTNDRPFSYTFIASNPLVKHVWATAITVNTMHTPPCIVG